MLQLKKRALPLNLRQSGNVDAKIKITTRLRKGPVLSPGGKGRVLGVRHVQPHIPPSGIREA